MMPACSRGSRGLLALRATLKRTIAELCEEDVRVLWLYYFNDRSVVQIAEQLDWDVSRVKVRLFRARNRLKRVYLKRFDSVGA